MEWQTLKDVLGELIKELGAKQRFLDFGCGPGVMIDYMNDAGFFYVGCDYSDEARHLYGQHFGKYPERYMANLENIDSQHFDVFISFDVFEHMTDEQIGEVLKTTANIPLLMLNISRDRRTPGHINIKSDQKWIEFFENRGCDFESVLSECLRNKYKILRVGCPDRWDRNLFVFSRVSL
ncbi:methyltransferase domain-containing protein [Methylomonas montana]|uniref:class I SAM-dependent methyltransferase n=1 Tax=Methylomonas montana TaxID=3058963 RepID=UPI0026593B6B|nr:methyltransferase domain-containing protein [Methylomonas montana]WKJ92031.1 methyltransferase domain-containing protein [Methylomonas montana]